MCTSLLTVVGLLSTVYFDLACSQCSGDEFVDLADYGCIRGIIGGTDAGKTYRRFSKIPFAKAPIPENNLRFENPEQHDGWMDVDYLNTTETTPACMQTDATGTLDVSEDCLYANVWTPYPMNDSIVEGDGYTVLVYIHGGSYLVGSSGLANYDGSVMATENNVIVVSFNYRLGSFGFLYNEGYELEGNYAYYDQMFAIEWFYNNIEYFGGNKDDINIFGESAGALSVVTLILNYGASSQDTDVYPYIKTVIAESPPLGLPQRTTNDWQVISELFVVFAGCSDASSVGECLRSSDVSAKDLLIAQTNASDAAAVYEPLFSAVPFTPTFETDILPQKNIMTAFETGAYNKDLPIIIGTNHDESDYFLLAILAGIESVDEPEDALDYLFGNISTNSSILGNFSSLVNINSSYLNDTVSTLTLDDLNSYSIEECTDLACVTDIIEKALQNGTNYTLTFADATWILDAMLFECPARYVAQQIYSSGNENIYQYHFNYYYEALALFFSAFGSGHICVTGPSVCHAAELPLVFLDRQFNDTYNSQDKSLSQVMQEYWTNFAKTGEPGVADDVTWGRFTAPSPYEGQESMEFTSGGENVIRDLYSNSEFFCAELWDNLGYCWLDGSCGTLPASKNDNTGNGDVNTTGSIDESADSNSTASEDSDGCVSLSNWWHGGSVSFALVLMSVVAIFA